MIAQLNKILSGDQDKWNREDSTGELNRLINEFVEDNDFMKSDRSREKPSIETKDIMIARLGYSQEETKHANDSYNESMINEIDRLLLDNIPSPTNVSGILADDKHVIRKSSKASKFKFGDDTSKVSGNILQAGSNNYEFERLASLILRENTQA
mmetsp:Transcript_32058/g.28422  ORF Transcript_32058/g.28422 Transcript_32058/m.28422 type:complete len:154 (+) Transcript_32058:201-662(+)